MTYGSRAAVAIAVIALTCSCTKGPHGLSADTYKGIQQTLSAMRRANEYRDSGTMLFEPRFLELEREADGIVVNNSADSSAASIARSCVKGLQIYRKSRDIYAAYLERREPLPKVPNWAAAEARKHADLTEKQMVDDARANVEGCIVTLGGYL